MNFRTVREYFGVIADEIDPNYPSRLYGFETLSAANADKVGTTHLLLPGGALYGFVACGTVSIAEHGRHDVYLGGDFFVLPGRVESVIRVLHGTACFIAQRKGYRAPRIRGEIEPYGRLRYIDGCSDSVLAAPPVKGEPCLNHLHFPSHVDQTMHSHPSVRVGITARGGGWCETPDTRVPLLPGELWIIPPGALHRFATEDDSMDVVPYHPDSDWGPEHETHPMVNRTLVDGGKIDNRGERHAPREIILGFDA
jgi:hypothetical protein